MTEREYHLVDDETGETIRVVTVADRDIEAYREVAEALGFYIE
jgi:hypothetical protein